MTSRTTGEPQSGALIPDDGLAAMECEVVSRVAGR